MKSQLTNEKEELQANGISFTTVVLTFWDKYVPIRTLELMNLYRAVQYSYNKTLVTKDKRNFTVEDLYIHFDKKLVQIVRI